MTTGRGLWAGRPGAACGPSLGGTLFKGFSDIGACPLRRCALTKQPPRSPPPTHPPPSAGSHTLQFYRERYRRDPDVDFSSSNQFSTTMSLSGAFDSNGRVIRKRISFGATE